MVIETGLRKTMVEELMKEIKGPRFGADEAISFNPWSEYLSGIVIPEDWVNDLYSSSSPDEEDISERDDGTKEDSSNDSEMIGNFSTKVLDPKSMIKSFGLSFYADIPNPKIEICATWGRYFKNKDRKGLKLNGTIEENEEEDVWERYSFGEIFEIEINEEEDIDETIYKEPKEKELVITKTLKNYETEKEDINREKDGYVNIQIRRRKTKNNLYIFSIYMLNKLIIKQNMKDSRPDIEKCLFQPSIRINFDDELIIKNKQIEMINNSEKELDFLYQNKPIKALGHMCSSIWEEIDYVDKINIEQLWPDYNIRLKNNKKYEEFKRPKLRTEFIPLYPVTLPNFDLEDNDKLNSEDFLASDLANKSPDEIYETLIQLPELYDLWIKENEKKKGEYEDYEEIVERLIKKEKNASSRIKKGIELIRDEDLVYTSFTFANKTIALQNEWSQIVKNQDKKEDEREIKEFKWRPFQIAFFLMNIEDIFNEDSKSKDTLDLLWIPTGGGKTEAYLGIMAYTIALRRLKAYQNNETGAGTSIISRYTLRLLTVQQFRRTLKMITAAEYLRVYKSENEIGWRPEYSKIKGNWIYGSTRFSTGLWVGGGVSPNHLIKKDGAMDLLKGEETQSTYSLGEPAQILKCPVCGTWLTVPETGLNDDINKLHIVIDSKSLSKVELETGIKKIIKDKPIDFIKISSNNHNPGFYTLSIQINDKYSRDKYQKDIATPIKKLGCEIASLSPLNIGYFSSLNKMKGEKIEFEGKFDFEIWCTNPECDLNKIKWIEGCPYPNSDDAYFPDGNFKREIDSPFKDNTRMPIPAYLIDDHVYTRCPTVVISTADKIARLAFEPKASAIFGNVTYYNKYIGFNRNKENIKELYPQFPHGLDIIDIGGYNKTIKPLKAPDLIIQDELHLIDGPLGSLFGLYEAMVSAIIEKQGGKPKYIASTATISNAEKQVDLLFSKKLSQFPPHGLDISNNFFVKDFDDDEAWEEDNPGRLYMGVYAPSRGPLTPKIRIWGRMVKVSEDYKKNPKHKNFWTVVGYYNAIRELGGALALYRDDIKNRLNVIYKTKEHRKLDEENLKELSSRIDSTELPIILDDLERDGLNDTPKYDAIFTTSMFGTGVDVSHLSLMIMNGQPKTTGSYIQATGRIGRDKGGLIVDFFRAGKPRDLNHYEMFPSFHSRIYLDVEPVSVSPFSKGCLSRGLGPSMVSFLRNATDLGEEWERNQGKTIRGENAAKDIDFIHGSIRGRLRKMKMFKDDEDTIDSILKNLKKCEEDWKEIDEEIEGKSPFEIYEYYYEKPQKSVVLGDSGHNYDEDLKVVFKNAPQSLRDVEETIDFWV